MTDIEVRCTGGIEAWRCSVRVIDGHGPSSFDVTSRDPAALLPLSAAAPTDHDVERLVRETFEFLLEREHVSSILSSFELMVVGRYFPEYPEEIRRRLTV
jgi:hypothetical protein